MDPLPMLDHVVMLPPPLSTHPDLVTAGDEVEEAT